MLLLSGMETDLSVVRHSGRAAFSVSVTGIALPFRCGVVAVELLPVSLIAKPDQRLLLALFMGTAMAISSVKIVATLRELGIIRRMVGQIILATAVIDDTIGWIIVSVLLGFAESGGIDVSGTVRSVFGTLAFLAFSMTIGRRLVFRVIRWTNDYFVSELPVITAIVVIMGAMALATEAIGVQTVLGAFVAGILIGESPILTRHIEEQLRGLIVAFFMPVFFGLAGIATNVAALGRPEMLLLTVGLIFVASVGKFSGAVIGGRIAGLSGAESFAVGCGMNARGSTEVIIASLGLSMSLIDESFFTAIVIMAILTTLAMPPMLRWAVRRLPARPEEAARLEREELESRLPLRCRAAAARGGCKPERTARLAPGRDRRRQALDSGNRAALRACSGRERRGPADDGPHPRSGAERRRGARRLDSADRGGAARHCPRRESQRVRSASHWPRAQLPGLAVPQRCRAERGRILRSVCRRARPARASLGECSRAAQHSCTGIWDDCLSPRRGVRRHLGTGLGRLHHGAPHRGPQRRAQAAARPLRHIRHAARDTEAIHPSHHR